MKILFSCMECVREELITKNVPAGEVLSSEYYKSIFADLNDNRVFERTCEKGHKTKLILQGDKYELLYEIGVMAITDGYYGEAILNFTSCLERFHEYCIRLFLYEKSINNDFVNLTWKYIDNSSERQLGAFFFLYLYCLNEKPDKFGDKYTSLRNKVTHKGYITSYEEAIEYGEAIRQYIIKICIKFRKEKRSIIDQITFKDIIERTKGEPMGTMGIPLLLSMAYADEYYGKDTLEMHINKLKSNRQIRTII